MTARKRFKGKGYLGVLLMKVGFTYSKSLEVIEDLAGVVDEAGYTIIVKKDDEA